VSLVSILVSRAAKEPEKPYLSFQGEPHSYAEVLLGARRVRSALEALGVDAGGRVILLLENGPCFFHAFFGALLHGAVPVPLSPRSTPDRAQALAIDCGASAALGDLESAEILSAVERLGVPVATMDEALGELASPDAPVRGPHAFVQYTSGSTGAPKGALLSQRAVVKNVRAFTRRMRATRSDVFGSMMPLFHDMGLVCFGLAPLYLGAPLFLYRAEALSLPRWIEGIARERITVTGGPDTLLRLATRVVRHPASLDLSSLRVVVCGSEPVFPGTVRRFEEMYRIPGRVKPAYGMAELSLCATLTGADETFASLDDRTVSCGRPIAGVRVAIDDGSRFLMRPHVMGEILVASPALMDGYIGAGHGAERYAAPGVLRTGDVGFLDDQCRLHVVGREKILVIRGGEKLSPADVEGISASRTEVALAAAVGRDTSRGEELALVLEVNRDLLSAPHAQRELARAICGDAQRRLGYRPDLVLFASRGRIPLALYGKVQHQTLRRQLAAGSFSAARVLGAAELV
jgi:acyl-CoA synthetase (AMP-forming)/AMP-acid ligase II